MESVPDAALKDKPRAHARAFDCTRNRCMKDRKCCVYRYMLLLRSERAAVPSSWCNRARAASLITPGYRHQRGIGRKHLKVSHR